MPRGFYDTVKVEYAVPKKRVEHSLTLYLKRVQSRVQLHQAILFGSYSKGTYSHGSDIDIAIIADGLPHSHGERYALLKASVLGLDLEPFAYTLEEWENMLKAGSSFAKEISKHGKILYSRSTNAGGLLQHNPADRNPPGPPRKIGVISALPEKVSL